MLKKNEKTVINLTYASTILKIYSNKKKILRSHDVKLNINKKTEYILQLKNILLYKTDLIFVELLKAPLDAFYVFNYCHKTSNLSHLKAFFKMK